MGERVMEATEAVGGKAAGMSAAGRPDAQRHARPKAYVP